MNEAQLRQIVERSKQREIQLDELQQELNRITARVAEIGRIRDRLRQEVTADADALRDEGYGHGV